MRHLTETVWLRRYKVTVTQTGFEKGPADNNGPWDFPVDWGLVTRGAITHSGVWRVTKAEETFTIAGVQQEPDFLSFARGWSFFGRVDASSTSNDVLVKQAMSDPDVTNRYAITRSHPRHSRASLVVRTYSTAVH